MKISDKQFVQHLVSWEVDSNELIHYFQVCEKLLKKYWRAIFTEKYLENIKKVSNTTYEMLVVLKKSNKDSALSIKNIIRIFKEIAKDYKPEFTIKSDSKDHNQKLEKHLKNTFQESNILQNQNIQDEIKISGEWRYYKRWFEQDVKKLLNLN